MLQKIYRKGRLIDLKPPKEKPQETLERLQERFLSNLSDSTEDRFWDLIDILKKNRVILMVDGKHVIIHNLSQQDMADYLGISRQMLHLITKKLSNENDILFNKGKIIY